MRTIYRHGPVEIVEMAAVTAPGFSPCSEFYVYNADALIRVCPSEGMAREVASSLS